VEWDLGYLHVTEARNPPPTGLGWKETASPVGGRAAPPTIVMKGRAEPSYEGPLVETVIVRST
jgi:hypothetical protein